MHALCLLGLALAVAPSQTKFGLAMMVPEGGGEPAFLDAMRQQIRLGLDGNALSLKWDEYEAQAGKPLTDGLGVMKFMGQEGLVTIATLDTIKRRLPPDVADKPWWDAELVKRWTGFLTRATAQFGPQVKWVSLGNEVDGYLGRHRDEVDGYLAFLAAGRDAVRKVRPDIKVGVTTMCMDGMKAPDLLARLQQGMDVTVFTYYPMDGFKVCDPSTLTAHFDFMAKIAGSRPLLLQEVGYPSSEKCGSSDEKQARFVHSAFAQIDRFGDRIPFAAFFMQADFPPSLLGALETYYGISEPTFLAFLGSLGLIDSKGKPRLAWDAFKEEALKRKPI